MCFLRRAGALVLLACFATVAMPAEAGTLAIRLQKPDMMKLLNQTTSWNLILDGEIDNDAPRRVAAVLAQVGNDGVDVYLNSPGGSLFAGMKIGRMIRQAGGSTHVGGLVADNGPKAFKRTWVSPTPGGCYSACSLAFLGGIYRYSDPKSEYGVHRFSSNANPTDSDLDTAQVISARIASYIREMDVDSVLFDLMVQSGKDGMRMLSQQELTSLRVINDGRGKPDWSIEAVKGGQYLRGTQSTVHGFGKSLFLCFDKQVMFQSYYMIGEEDAKSVAKGGRVHSLLTDGKSIRLNAPAEAVATQNEIMTMFVLTREQALTLARSAKIGHAMQAAYDAPTFQGYYIDVPKESRSKVETFIQNCYQ